MHAPPHTKSLVFVGITLRKVESRPNDAIFDKNLVIRSKWFLHAFLWIGNMKKKDRERCTTLTSKDA